ncbi:threonine-phosphate decarboxylase [Gymnodinialimonas ceratoperidinii]|uniref:Pyridoxal phosphate-dependent class II aminotransferase n=1 Tax=Gymnodinialimonas ceratoperidinii TaxID=2856823 RepID=A0A8F6TY93_9RHOB|nr:threonine-phosphate decarboxylase [Gymnodinialimonas ceratoperidinii]QXT40143.1 pyridoxal phosphate-dependent class II aminotransferase [Gymnodinialimonas ceratoperidinii]
MSASVSDTDRRGPPRKRDHGGGLDAAAARFGGTPHDWLDLSTGINPVPYPLGDISAEAWHRLPGDGAMEDLLHAARTFWNVPETAEIIAAAGASPLISLMPELAGGQPAHIPAPTYNEHAAAFAARGQGQPFDDPAHPVHVYVHPNNPDGRLWPDAAGRALTVIDESFCDVTPEASQIARTAKPGTVVLKSFGKFWGLAGLRLGFAIAHPDTLRNTATGVPLSELMGPWTVSGPALEVGARALRDTAWAEATRTRLAADAARLDALIQRTGATSVGGTTLFRTYAMPDRAAQWQEQLARHHIWSRIFPYSDTWLRLGLPGSERDWARLEAAL